MSSIARPPVYRVVIAQLLVLLPLCGLMLIHSQLAAISACAGSLVCILPNAYFASYAFRYMGAQAAKHVARSFYQGETGKFLLTVIGFALVFLWLKPINLPAMFTGYGVMLVLQWFVAARVIAKH